MAATPGDAYTAPACRTAVHEQCHGNTETHAGGFSAPLERLRCACPCHSRPRPD
jgi:hypothetical protein